MATSLGKNSRLYVSTDGGTTFIPVGKTLTVSKRQEQADDEEIFVHGEELPITEVGDLTGSLDVTMLQDLADAGQTALRAALTAGTDLIARFMYNGTTGADQSAKVLNRTIDSDANGTGINRFVRESMALRLAGAEDTATLP